MEKLSEEWRLYELYCQYHFEKTCREGKAGKVREKIVGEGQDAGLEEVEIDLNKFSNAFTRKTGVMLGATTTNKLSSEDLSEIFLEMVSITIHTKFIRE